MAENEEQTSIRFRNLEAIDTVTIEIVPEKKGLFIKHTEYTITSKRYCSQVYRRYNDFFAFYELLLSRFPYRLLPKLPPKKITGVISGDSNFLEKRRNCLERWINIIARHPVISNDTLVNYFLTQSSSDACIKIKEVFKCIPDEFSTSELAAKAKQLVPPNNNNDFALSRQHVRIIYNLVQKIEIITDHISLRSKSYKKDMEDLSTILTDMDNMSHTNWGTGGNNSWNVIQTGLGVISKEFHALSNKTEEHDKNQYETLSKRIYVLLDILSGHEDLCQRVEKGVSLEHQNALSKMMVLKKRQIQGVLRGHDAEDVAALENRMLQQENVIASVELRTAFSLYCVRMETTLVHAYLETLADVLMTLVSLQNTAHAELAEIWSSIQSKVETFLPKID